MQISIFRCQYKLNFVNSLIILANSLHHRSYILYKQSKNNIKIKIRIVYVVMKTATIPTCRK